MADKSGIKMILIGDSGSGKSSLLLSYTEERFLPPGEAIATVGVDFRLLKRDLNGAQYKVYIWDTAGQERFRTLTSSFYRGAAVVFVVFDVSNRDSFTNLSTWVAEAKRFCAAEKRVLMCIVANKLDVDPAERQVTTEEAKAYAEENGAEYREVSARTMDGVKCVVFLFSFVVMVTDSSPFCIRPLFDEFAEKVVALPPPATDASATADSNRSVKLGAGAGANAVAASGSCAC
ncbi:ras family-domain-containing protein [Blastocladiella britannica]|nr:ras family-domain-containing protein [Blastocladiella britannica]